MIPITRPQLPLDEYRALLEQIWASRMLSNFGSMAQGLEGLAAEYLGIDTRVVVTARVAAEWRSETLAMRRCSASRAPSP